MENRENWQKKNRFYWIIEGEIFFLNYQKRVLHYSISVFSFFFFLCGLQRVQFFPSDTIIFLTEKTFFHHIFQEKRFLLNRNWLQIYVNPKEFVNVNHNPQNKHTKLNTAITTNVYRRKKKKKLYHGFIFPPWNVIRLIRCLFISFCQ